MGRYEGGSNLGFLFPPPSGEAYQSISEEYVKENIIQMGVVVHACNPSIRDVMAKSSRTLSAV